MSVRIFLPAALAGLALISAPAQAADSLWMHNGSVMYYHADGSMRMFIYYKPRKGLEHLRGQVLFEGQKRGFQMGGLAYTFRKGCAPAPYQVGGDLDTPGRIVLDGAAPVREAGGCRIAGHDPKSPNARLVFTYLRKVPKGMKPPPAAQPQGR